MHAHTPYRVSSDAIVSPTNRATTITGACGRRSRASFTASRSGVAPDQDRIRVEMVEREGEPATGRRG
jgi:hypothetical protein